MSDQTKNTKPRPVDVLFGDGDAPAMPNYTVEPAQPATTATPPALDSVASAAAASGLAASTPVALPAVDASEEADASPSPSSDEPTMVTPEPADPTPSFTSSIWPDSHETELDSRPSLFASESLAAPARKSSSTRLAQLADRVDLLYGDVKMDFHDSKVVTEYCFQLLMQARQAIEDEDYPRAEFFVQSVDAKLKRSQKSAKAARGLGVIFIWLWEFIALGVGAAVLATTYVINLTLFGLPVVADLQVLLRSVGWGMIGAVIGAMYSLPWFIQHREYDPAYNMNYFARPIVGALLGAVMFMISQTGILAGSLIVGDVKVGPIFLYFFALLAGFKQEYVGAFLDNLVHAIFRGPQAPGGLKPPQVK